MKKIITIALFISTFLFGCSSSDSSSSNTGQWELTNLASNINFGRICSASNTIFITDGIVIHRSTDNGDSWSAVDTGLNNVISYDIFVINGIIHLSATKNIGGSYATNYYKSTNNGDSWIEVWNNLANDNLGYGFPKRIFYVGSKLFGAVIYGFDNTKIVSSADNGITWNLLPNTFNTTEMVQFDYFENNFMFDGSNYYLTDTSGIYKSNDGVNFTLINNVPNGGVRYSTNLGNKIYITPITGVQVTSNNGVSWTDINNGIEYVAGSPFPLNFLYSNGQNIYTGGASGVFVLNNTSWNQVGSNIEQVRKITSNNNYIFVKAQGGLYRYAL